MKRTCVFRKDENQGFPNTNELENDPNISIIPDSIDRLAVIKPHNAFFVHF